jgi:hypothetical protein
MVHSDFRANKHLSTSSYTIQTIRICGIEKTAQPKDVFAFIDSLPIPKEKLIPNPILSTWIPPLSTNLEATATPTNEFFHLEPNLKLNNLFATQGTFTEQIWYLRYMGITDKIDRRPDLQAAVEYYRFVQRLKELNVTNRWLPLHDNDPLFIDSPIHRIHAVHLDYLYDAEISAGLHVFIRKNIFPEDQVLFVCNPKSLESAIQLCAPHATLTLDGHWMHSSPESSFIRPITYGVWWHATPSMICDDLYQLMTIYPNKIDYIRSLGCHCGKLIDSNEILMLHCQEQQFTFKDEYVPQFYEREQALFRNRAVFVSEQGESPFDEFSLAGMLFQRFISSTPPIPIVLSASISYVYPYPAHVPQAIFNVGSDGDEWSNELEWHVPSDDPLLVLLQTQQQQQEEQQKEEGKELSLISNSTRRTWIQKLRTLKSLTCVHRNAIDLVQPDSLPIWFRQSYLR